LHWKLRTVLTNPEYNKGFSLVTQILVGQAFALHNGIVVAANVGRKNTRPGPAKLAVFPLVASTKFVPAEARRIGATDPFGPLLSGHLLDARFQALEQVIDVILAFSGLLAHPPQHWGFGFRRLHGKTIWKCG
jgi:hypothetical protein